MGKCEVDYRNVLTLIVLLNKNKNEDISIKLW